MELNVKIVDGVIVTPNLHDANIFGLEFRDNRDLLLAAKLVDGSIVSLIFKDVYRLVANNFREGNIILDVSVTESSDIDLEDVIDFYQASENLPTSLMMSIISNARLEKKRLVNISSSYGCELISICGQILYESREK